MRRLLVWTRELVAQKSAVLPSAGFKLSVAEGREPVRRTAEHLEDRAGGHENERDGHDERDDEHHDRVHLVLLHLCWV